MEIELWRSLCGLSREQDTEFQNPKKPTTPNSNPTRTPQSSGSARLAHLSVAFESTSRPLTCCDAQGLDAARVTVRFTARAQKRGFAPKPAVATPSDRSRDFTESFYPQPCFCALRFRPGER